MSKHINTSGNYTIKVVDDGVITLDTGNNIGQVRVTGDLVITGTTTNVSSTDLNIKDNIIVLNSDETGAGVTKNSEAGIRIERGSLADVQFLFNENISWNDPVSQTTKTGAFVLKDESGNNIGLEVRAISTGGGDLNLINSGTGVIDVSGTNNYETQVVDDDHIPNLKKVVEVVDDKTANLEVSRILDNNTVVRVIDTVDLERAEVDINGTITSTFYNNRTEFHDLRIYNSTIETTISSADLTLSAPGTGSVVIDDQLHIKATPSPDDATVDPAAPTEGLKLYVKDPGAGKTGLFYVNSNNVRDEILSKNRSLLLSMIF
jgi:hypothetical protein